MPARAATASSVKFRPPDSRITLSAASSIRSRSISFFRVKFSPLLFRLSSRITFPTDRSDYHDGVRRGSWSLRLPPSEDLYEPRRTPLPHATRSSLGPFCHEG